MVVYKIDSLVGTRKQCGKKNKHTRRIIFYTPPPHALRDFGTIAFSEKKKKLFISTVYAPVPRFEKQTLELSVMCASRRWTF